jgi:hypothetical protein
MLVNFFYAQPVGHAVEALHYCLGHHAAIPEARISVALNAATAVELAGFCPFIADAYAIDHPLLEPCADSAARQTVVPEDWDWVLDDFRRHQAIQLEMFPGLRDYYRASDARLRAAHGRTTVAADPPGYLPHQHMRLDLPERARTSAAARWAAHDAGDPADRRIALMPAGSSAPELYPSRESWLTILDALAHAFPSTRVALIGKRTRDERTATAVGASDLSALLAHPSRPLNCFDLPLAEQLAVVESCDLFLSPHTGFGLAALAVDTPWLTLSGGRWFEYFFNHVPFRAILPDTGRYPSFSQLAPAQIIDDDGPRTPSMTRERIERDLPRIVAAAGELLAKSLSYEQALRDYFPALLAAHHGDPTPIWSIDGIHLRYLPES